MNRVAGCLDYEITDDNADEDQMEQAFSDFGARLREAGPEATGFFFFAALTDLDVKETACETIWSSNFHGKNQ